MRTIFAVCDINIPHNEEWVSGLVFNKKYYIEKMFVYSYNNNVTIDVIITAIIVIIQLC